MIHRQGFEYLSQVRRYVLEPNGSFYVEAVEPPVSDRQHAEVLARLEAPTRKVAALRAQAAEN